MKSIYLTNWTRPEELMGGCEYVFKRLQGFLKGSQNITATDVSEIYLGNRKINYTNYLILERIKLFRDFFKDVSKFNKGKKVIIANDCTMPNKNKDYTLITYAQNPYLIIGNYLHDIGVYNRPLFYEFGELYSDLQKKQFLNSDKIVSVSSFMQNYVKQLCGKDSDIIEHGIDTEVFQPMNKDKLKEKYSIPKDKKVGVWVGAFHPSKNYFVIPELVKKYPDIHWILVFKHKLKQKSISKNVSCFEMVDHSTLSELYNCADFMINPSLFESFNLVSLEAMACNVPIITFNTGYFFKDNSEEEETIYRQEYYGIVIHKMAKEVMFEVVDKILVDEFEPRKYILDNELTIEGWEKRWQKYLLTNDL